jgi:hypothetical protein
MLLLPEGRGRRSAQHKKKKRELYLSPEPGSEEELGIARANGGET